MGSKEFLPSKEKAVKHYLLDHWSEHTDTLREELEWYKKRGKDKIFARVCGERLVRVVRENDQKRVQ